MNICLLLLYFWGALAKTSTEPGWMVGSEIYLMPSRWQIFPPRVDYLFAQRCWHARISDSYRSVWKMWFARIWKQAARLGEHSRPKAKVLPTVLKCSLCLWWRSLNEIIYISSNIWLTPLISIIKCKRFGGEKGKGVERSVYNSNLVLIQLWCFCQDRLD